MNISFLTPLALMLNYYQYGLHYPHAYQAFQWVTSPTMGTYRAMEKIEYIWNYYDHPEPLPPNHPYDKSAVIAYANGTQFTTCRDANAHLLFDYNHDGELDVTTFPANSTYAFMEHSGRGVNNEVKGNPFSNFWFDDNSLAKYMTSAYGYPDPSGLHEYDDFTRWRIVGGNATNWTPYGGEYMKYNDQLALNGMYYLAIQQHHEAYSCWKQILSNTQASWNQDMQRFDYVNMHESYHYGLFLMLTSMLRLFYPDDNLLLQHYVSIRSNILSFQITDATTTLEHGPFYSWTSDSSGGTSLMNTESASTNILGLGANVMATYEVGRDPLRSDAMKSSYFLRTHNVLSAVEGLSSPGYLSFGPYVTLPTGNYRMEVFIRSGSLTSTSSTWNEIILKVDVYDSTNQQMLSQLNVYGSHFHLGNEWAIASLDFVITGVENVLEYRVWYVGKENIDVSIIRIKVQ